MEIIYFYGLDMQIFEIEKFTDISHSTVIEWYKKLRRLMKKILESDPLTLKSLQISVIQQ